MVTDIRRYYDSILLDANGNNNIPRLIIGLSGGIDSSVVTAFAVLAVEPNNVIPITLPHYYDANSIRRAIFYEQAGIRHVE